MPHDPNPNPRLSARVRSLALVLGLAGAATAALARDVELFEHPEFRGTRLTQIGRAHV